MGALPEVLAGPIVRRVEPQLCSFWIALSHPASVQASIWRGIQEAGAEPGKRRRCPSTGSRSSRSRDLRIAEEEVPREGAIVERSFQHARWFDGRSLLWLGRRKTVGRGEGASGLRFDALDRR